MHQYPHIRLHVFAKAPVLNTVKTRLQPHFMPEFSLKLHCTLVDYCLEAWRESAVCPLQLWVAGDKKIVKQKLVQWQGVPMFSQVGESLGERLLHSAQSSLNDDVRAVLLVGTDCPFINSEYLQKACAALTTHDVVIGPADDGGYVLLGLKQAHTTLFDDIDWGTGQVYSQTLAAISQSKLSHYVLPTLADIDRPDDVQKLAPIKVFEDFT